MTERSRLTHRELVQLTFASYNIHKAVGRDRRRDPDRILAVLREIDADIVALQEADRRFGRRASVLPLSAIRDHTAYDPVPLTMKPDSIGWHGNALLVKRHIDLVRANPVPLPVLEPRGALCADLRVNGQLVRAVGMHLDLSGLRRRHQVRSILDYLADCGDAPAVLMGDFNEWALHGGCFREFGDKWNVVTPGRSFPSRRPVAHLDRIVASADWKVLEAGVHHSAASAVGSDHLPISATLQLPNYWQ